MAELYLSLGSNLGDRSANIDRAIGLLNEHFGSVPKGFSPRIETEAVGFSGEDFINCIVVYECSLDPYEVLDVCKEVERSMGRTDKPEYDLKGNRIYHNRIIDVDILLYGDVSIDTERLTIPHPQVLTRPFVRELLSSFRK